MKSKKYKGCKITKEQKLARKEIKDMLFKDQSPPTKEEMDKIRNEWEKHS